MKLLLALCLISCSAHAASHFDVVFDRFQKAGPAAFADLDGAAYSGRCFLGEAATYSEGGPLFRITPDDAFGGLLVGKSAVRAKDDAGPGFPSARKLYVQAVFSMMHHPIFFEDAALKDELAELDPTDSALVPATIVRGDLTFGFLPGDGGDARIVVRKSGSTLYMLQTTHVDRTACYYFKKLN